ncbi:MULTISPECIES: hypothetical protein [unclassified Leifsonia]|uniref:hypothetical protein n=1 Tax=unclassified Leifsonia TaxID=2663824 RepID=UPI0006F7C6EA|nr:MULTISPECIES: hypothetical protein [unclassified Leifsonia]KQX07698.1 hypothetical protein ASC59_08180 [Leifsonia sp. Root1293]KRA11980.1 hypothetical protein ASD61_08180 [Leifsonia sp. Root60]
MIPLHIGTPAVENSADWRTLELFANFAVGDVFQLSAATFRTLLALQAQLPLYPGLETAVPGLRDSLGVILRYGSFYSWALGPDDIVRIVVSSGTTEPDFGPASFRQQEVGGDLVWVFWFTVPVAFANAWPGLARLLQTRINPSDMAILTGRSAVDAAEAVAELEAAPVLTEVELPPDFERSRLRHPDEVILVADLHHGDELVFESTDFRWILAFSSLVPALPAEARGRLGVSPAVESTLSTFVRHAYSALDDRPTHQGTVRVVVVAVDEPSHAIGAVQNVREADMDVAPVLQLEIPKSVAEIWRDAVRSVSSEHPLVTRIATPGPEYRAAIEAADRFPYTPDFVFRGGIVPEYRTT